MRMPSGKFANKELHLIPSNYLRWIAENWDDEELCKEADDEWQWREKYGEHWE